MLVLYMFFFVPGFTCGRTLSASGLGCVRHFPQPNQAVPGHHAEPSQPRGFCLFGNVALGAALAQAKGAALRGGDRTTDATAGSRLRGKDGTQLLEFMEMMKGFSYYSC